MKVGSEADLHAGVKDELVAEVDMVWVPEMDNGRRTGKGSEQIRRVVLVKAGLNIGGDWEKSCGEDCVKKAIKTNLEFFVSVSSYYITSYNFHLIPISRWRIEEGFYAMTDQ